MLKNNNLKTFRVTVNGTAYDVTVEEISGAAASAPAPTPAPVPAPTPAPAPTPKAAPAPKAAVGGGEPVKAPMPGNILDVKVAVGDKIKANDVVVILEAMKMENEIVSPVGGTVTSVAVSKGQAVNSDDVLITVG